MKKSYKPQCAFYLSMDPAMKNFVQKNLVGFPLQFFTAAVNEKNVRASTEVLGVFVDSKITEKILQKMPQLKLIVALSTGYDNIDLEAAKKRGITVCNVPAYGEVTVAEHAFTLMLSILKNIPASNVCVKNGVFDCRGLKGHDLQGKTVGVVGTGKIGIHFIQMLQGFGVKVLASDAFPRKELQQQNNFTYVSLKKLLASSDIVSLHVPLLKETTHLLNKETFGHMKKGSILINTSRGPVVDSVALAQALKKGIIAGAGLDVIDGEEYVKGLCEPQNPKAKKMCEANHFLMHHDRVLMTPHNAFNTVEAVERIFQTSIAAIEDFSKGKAVKNKIV